MILTVLRNPKNRSRMSVKIILMATAIDRSQSRRKIVRTGRISRADRSRQINRNADAGRDEARDVIAQTDRSTLTNRNIRTNRNPPTDLSALAEIVQTAEIVTTVPKNERMNQKVQTIDLKEGERLDDLQRNGFSLIQNPGRFCFGMDAVLLSGFARAKEGAKVLDLGTGTGIIPILMAAKTKAHHLTGLEIQEESADMARRSVLLNHLEEKIDIVTGDIKEAAGLFGASSFDVVTCNPPYMIGCHGLTNPEAPKAIARHELLCTFDDVVAAAGRLLKPGGDFFLVHRPFRLVEIMVKLHEAGLEPKRMRLVYPYADREPNMVLLEANRGGKPRLTVEKPLIIYEKEGVYSEEIREDYGY